MSTASTNSWTSFWRACLIITPDEQKSLIFYVYWWLNSDWRIDIRLLTFYVWIKYFHTWWWNWTNLLDYPCQYLYYIFTTCTRFLFPRLAKRKTFTLGVPSLDITGTICSAAYLASNLFIIIFNSCSLSFLLSPSVIYQLKKNSSI